MHWKGISCRAGLDNNGQDSSVQSHHGKPPPNISKGVITCKASSRSKRTVEFFRQMLGKIDRQQETPSGIVCLANRKRCKLPSCVTVASAMDASVTINEMERFVCLFLIRTVDCLPKWRGELLPFDLLGWRPCGWTGIGNAAHLQLLEGRLAVARGASHSGMHMRMFLYLNLTSISPLAVQSKVQRLIRQTT
jgi:hypothetical protein